MPTYENTAHNCPWELYDQLIANVPEDIAIRDVCLGTKWSYVEAECGMGCAWTARAGAKRTNKADLRSYDLRTLAQLSKSWCFEEATLGIAALNAWYAQRERLDALRATYDDPADAGNARGMAFNRDAFDAYRPQIENMGGSARVVVVGHFPNVSDMTNYAQVTVLERNCRDELDTPDPACEYVLPDANFAFITGVTFINKTLPRLLALAKNASVIMVGPSVVMSPLLFNWGVKTLAGSIVSDPEALRAVVKNGAGALFGNALQMTSLRAR